MILIQTEEQIASAFTVLDQAKIMVVDTETTKDDRNDLLGLGTTVEHDGMLLSFYFPFYHLGDNSLFGNIDNLSPVVLKRLSSYLTRPNCEYVYHNAKFDLKILKRQGINPPPIWWDTMIMAHMLDENRSKKLDQLAKLLLGAQKESLKELEKLVGGWSYIPILAMAKYCCQDTELTYKLFKLFIKQLHEQELSSLWPLEREFSLVLGEIEDIGIEIDPRIALELSQQSLERLKDLRSQIGFDPLKTDLLIEQLFAAPPIGLGLKCVSWGKKTSVKWPKGQPITDKKALQALNHPTAMLAAQIRTENKANSTWFAGFLDALGDDGRLHPYYKLHGTRTTRLSCKNPNMQQLPRTSDEEQEEGISRALVKTMLKAKEGYELWEYDYSQIEYRLCAVYSEEESIVNAYLAGSDFHQVTADKLGIPRVATDGSKKEGKTLNFTMVYGGYAKTIAALLEVPFATAKQLYSEFWNSYPNLAARVAEAERIAQYQGYVKMWTGRRRHFTQDWECRKAFNSIIQGGAAEILKQSMVNMNQVNIRMIAQVHDSVWIEVPNGTIEDTDDIIRKCMEWPGEKFGIPFPVDRKQLA